MCRKYCDVTVITWIHLSGSYMKSRGISDDLINRHLQLDDGDGEDSVYHVDTIDLKQRYPDHCIVNNWYYPLYSRSVMVWFNYFVIYQRKSLLT